MKEYLIDSSERKIYTKIRIVGHLMALASICKFIYIAKSIGIESLNLEYKLMNLFFIINWFIFIPVILLLFNLSIAANDQVKGKEVVQRAVVYYVWAPVSALAFAYLFFESF